jgi:mannose-6-phosphate isomerase-like protein (cupin superfamily)
MSKIIKANVMARKASLLESTNQVSLFRQNQTSCIGVYLLATKEYSRNVTKNETIILSVFKGSGELSCNGNTQPLKIQVIVGDIIEIPEDSSFSLLNTSAEELIVSLVTLKA